MERTCYECPDTATHFSFPFWPMQAVRIARLAASRCAGEAALCAAWVEQEVT